MNCRFTQFVFHKVDVQTGMGIPGAVFRLLCSRQSGFTATSGAQGAVRFRVPFPGCFTLFEETPPEGYAPNAEHFHITTDPRGNVFVNGCPARGFVISNLRQAVYGTLDILKTDQGGSPLSGATFALASNGVPIESQTSGTGGLMRFEGIAPGVYTLAETQAPHGFMPHTQVYSVDVSPSGEVMVNGASTSLLTVNDSPVTIPISGTKTWNDYNNILNMRPVTFTVGLFRNGVPYQTQQISSFGNAFTFSDVLKYAPDGTEYVYTISEYPIPGYFAQINGYDIVNTLYA